MRLLVRALMALAALAVISTSGCQRPPPEPSPEYDKAWRIYANLYARQLDDAFGNPQMDDVVTLLKRVDPRSSDAEAAKTLLSRIDDGKKTLVKERAEAEKRKADIKPSPPPASILQAAQQLDIRSVAPAEAPAAIDTDAGTPDAGPASKDPFAQGAPIAELNRDGCLMAGEPFSEGPGSKAMGQTYRLAPSSSCQSKLAGLQGQVILVVDGRIYRRVSEKDAKFIEDVAADRAKKNQGGAQKPAEQQPEGQTAPYAPPKAPPPPLNPDTLPAGQLPPETPPANPNY